MSMLAIRRRFSIPHTTQVNTSTAQKCLFLIMKYVSIFKKKKKDNRVKISVTSATSTHTFIHTCPHVEYMQSWRCTVDKVKFTHLA